MHRIGIAIMVVGTLCCAVALFKTYDGDSERALKFSSAAQWAIAVGLGGLICSMNKNGEKRP